MAPRAARRRSHFRRAAEAGDFRAQFNMGTLALAEGRVAAAMQWFRQAAATGSPGFLSSMAVRLVARPDPALRALAAEIQARLASLAD